MNLFFAYTLETRSMPQSRQEGALEKDFRIIVLGYPEAGQPKRRTLECSYLVQPHSAPTKNIPKRPTLAESRLE